MRATSLSVLQYRKVSSSGVYSLISNNAERVDMLVGTCTYLWYQAKNMQNCLYHTDK
jgi:hypothetical protein